MVSGAEEQLYICQGRISPQGCASLDKGASCPHAKPHKDDKIHCNKIPMDCHGIKQLLCVPFFGNEHVFNNAEGNSSGQQA